MSGLVIYLGGPAYIGTALLVARRLHVSKGDELMQGEVLFLGAIWPIFLTFTAVTRLVKATIFCPTPSEREAKRYEREEAERREAERVIAAYDRSNRALPDPEKIVDLDGNIYDPPTSNRVRSVMFIVTQMNADELLSLQKLVRRTWHDRSWNSR
jgi:hypothetical protein